MSTSGLGAIDRRMAIGGALAGAAAGLALPRRQGRPVIQRGMVGGGLVRFEQGEANFSLFVSRLIFPDDPEVIVGSVLWVDGVVGLTLKSTRITEYIVPPDQPEQGTSRQIHGTMSVNDEGEHPFELEVIDVGLPGSGTDMANLKVGDGARTSENATPASGLGFSYLANGTVVTGDIQELDLEIDLATGAVTPAED